MPKGVGVSDPPVVNDDRLSLAKLDVRELDGAPRTLGTEGGSIGTGPLELRFS